MVILSMNFYANTDPLGVFLVTESMHYILCTYYLPDQIVQVANWAFILLIMSWWCANAIYIRLLRYGHTGHSYLAGGITIHE